MADKTELSYRQEMNMFVIQVLDVFSLNNIHLGLLGNVVSSLACEKPSYHMCIKVISLPGAEEVWVPV